MQRAGFEGCGMPFVVQVKSWQNTWQMQEMAQYLQMQELVQRSPLAQVQSISRKGPGARGSALSGKGRASISPSVAFSFSTRFSESVGLPRTYDPMIRGETT